jgi:putative transposase
MNYQSWFIASLRSLMSRFNAADRLTPHPLAKVSSVSLSNSSKYTGKGFVGFAFIVDYLVDIRTIPCYYWNINFKTKPMQVRWNYKLQPNKGQSALMDEWLVTLRKHRNYCLAERKRGFEGNNLESVEPIGYNYGAYCDTSLEKVLHLGKAQDRTFRETRIEYDSYCPLTCSVVKHGVLPERINLSQAIKFSKPNSLNGEMKISWDSIGGIQSKRTTQLRSENYFYGRIDSDVLQSNLAKLDTAYSGFFKHQRGFPAFRKASNFKTFQFKPGRCKVEVNRSSNNQKCYSHIYLPGIGRMRYLDSRAIPESADIRTITVMKKTDGWHISVLLKIEDELPVLGSSEVVESAVGIDMGINRLIALSNGSFVENPRFATNKRTGRRLRIRQRRVNRKVKGSNNRRKAGIAVAKLHQRISNQRDDYQWKAAHKVVAAGDVIVREDLNIKAMKSRCKPKRVKGRFMPNGQSAKRGLNRSISDASWGSQFEKIEWVAAKAGKPVIAVNPKHTSQECSACGHVSKTNRQGEKFVCESCGHIDHADTQASRTILKRAKLKFVSTDIKSLRRDSAKVTAVKYDSAQLGERSQGSNGISKAAKSAVLGSPQVEHLFKTTMPEKPISAMQSPLQLSLF